MKAFLAFLLIFSVALLAQSHLTTLGVGVGSVPPAGGGGISGGSFVTNGVSACYNFTGTGTACVAAVHHGPSTGNLLIVGVAAQDNSSNTISVSGSCTGAWTALGSLNRAGGQVQQHFAKASSPNCGGGDTLTVTSSQVASFIVWESTEYSYTGTITGTDGTPVTNNGSAVASLATSSAISITNSTGIRWAFCGTANSCSVGTGYTSRNDTSACVYNNTTCSSTGDFLSNTGNLVEDKFNGATGSQTATFGTSGATDFFAISFVAY
jgi:hypothetical protein